MAIYDQVCIDVAIKLNVNGLLDKILTNIQSTANVNEKFQVVDQLRKIGYFNQPVTEMKKLKNNELSTRFRNLGNKCFASNSNEEYLMALKLYNESICYAENNSEELSLGFANRSAVYYALELYDDCLINIKLAKTNGYPTHLMHKLIDRETKCLERRVEKIMSVPIIEPQLSVPGNPRVPFVADCLKLEKNVQYGRHVITTSDLNVGDVVAVEAPFCSTLPKKFKYMRCENCLKENNYNLFPCKQCVSVMFCGDKCCDESYIKFHKFECPVIDYMEKMLCKFGLITLRTVICAITNFNSIDELIAFMHETKGQDFTVFNWNYGSTSHNSYGPVHFLSEKMKTKNRLEELNRCILAQLIYLPLLEHTEFNEMFTTSTAVAGLKELVHHTIKTLAINSSSSLIINDNFLQEFAKGVYPLRSMLNHSCAPNMMITSSEKKMVFTVSKPIKAGEQLFVNYDVHFMCDPFIERQMKFRNFKCQCVACENKYPLYRDLPMVNIPNLNIVKTVSKESLKLYADYINKYANYYPCKQLVFAEGEFQYHLECIYKTEMLMATRYK